MGWRAARQMLTAVFKGCGQPAGGPSAVPDQSKDRGRSAISPSAPGKNSCGLDSMANPRTRWDNALLGVRIHWVRFNFRARNCLGRANDPNKANFRLGLAILTKAGLRLAASVRNGAGRLRLVRAQEDRARVDKCRQ